jgi:hypothetical protein
MGPRTTTQAGARKAYRKENERRVRAIARSIRTMYHWPAPQSRDGSSTGIIDLLADIRHYCDAYELDFGKLDKTAYRHYTAEVVQARTGEEQ